MLKAKAKLQKAKMPAEPSEGQQSNFLSDTSNLSSQPRYKVGDIVRVLYGNGDIGPHYLLIKHKSTVNSTFEICVETWECLNIDTSLVGEYGFLPPADKVVA